LRRLEKAKAQLATNSKPPEVNIMSPAELAIYVGLSESMLAKMRCLGGGPEYFKLGRAVRYPQSDVDGWLADRRVRHSSDAARLPVRLTEPKKGGSVAE
jgi:predicted DNA-binding transcriptional regulator AlpA